MKFSLEPVGRFQLTSPALEGAFCFPDECKHPLPRFATAIAFGHNTCCLNPTGSSKPLVLLPVCLDGQSV